MYYCKIYDCKISDNNCKECIFRDKCDYVWVSELWKENQDLLTILMPAWVKQSFINKQVISITKEHDFCVFLLPKRRPVIVIQDICVSDEYKGEGIANKLLHTLMREFDRDIVAKCVIDSSAESFWKYKGIKIEEEKGKKRKVATYLVRNDDIKQKKVDLFGGLT